MKRSKRPLPQTARHRIRSLPSRTFIKCERGEAERVDLASVVGLFRRSLHGGQRKGLALPRMRDSAFAESSSQESAGRRTASPIQNKILRDVNKTGSPDAGHRSGNAVEQKDGHHRRLNQTPDFQHSLWAKVCGLTFLERWPPPTPHGNSELLCCSFSYTSLVICQPTLQASS